MLLQLTTTTALLLPQCREGEREKQTYDSAHMGIGSDCRARSWSGVAARPSGKPSWQARGLPTNKEAPPHSGRSKKKLIDIFAVAAAVAAATAASRCRTRTRREADEPTSPRRSRPILMRTHDLPFFRARKCRRVKFPSKSGKPETRRAADAVQSKQGSSTFRRVKPPRGDPRVHREGAGPGDADPVVPISSSSLR